MRRRGIAVAIIFAAGLVLGATFLVMRAEIPPITPNRLPVTDAALLARGMVHARVVRPPSYGARLVSVDVTDTTGPTMRR